LDPASAVLSPDGSTVAYTTSGPGGAKVWLLDASDLRVAASIALGHGASAVVFGPDSRSLAALSLPASASADSRTRCASGGSRRRHDRADLVTSAPAPRAPRALGAVAFSPDGRTLAVSGQHRPVAAGRGDLADHQERGPPPGVSGGPVYRPDGQVLAVGGRPRLSRRRIPGGAVCLLDAATLDPITRPSVPALDAYSLTFSPDGRTRHSPATSRPPAASSACWTPPPCAPWPRACFPAAPA